MKLDVLSPEETIFSGEVSSISLPGLNGRLQVLQNHAPIISALGAGSVWIEATSIEEIHTSLHAQHQNAQEFHFEIKGGVVEMLQNKVVVLLD